MKPLLLGIAASFFFAFTFVLNRAMDLSGGSWAWSASLRYFFMVPLLLMLVYFWGCIKPVVAEIKSHGARSDLAYFTLLFVLLPPTVPAGLLQELGKSRFYRGLS